MSTAPVYNLPYVGENYTGPFLSNGQFQSSVAFGDVPPSSQLDAISRLHDTAYATFTDFGHRTAADAIYNDEAKQLESLFPQLAGSVVLFGNESARAAANLVGGLKYGPLGFIVGAAENMYNLHDYMLNEKRYKAEVLALYAKDPYKPVVRDNVGPLTQDVYGEPMEAEVFVRPTVFERTVERYERGDEENRVVPARARFVRFPFTKKRRKRRMVVV
jgi:hypothetical protein